MDQNKPLLTLAHVRGWEVRVTELAALIRAHTEEMNSLARKIEAAKVFMDPMASGEDGAEDETVLASSANTPAMEIAEESISQGVLAAVGAMSGSPKPSLIRKWIATHNPEVAVKLDASPAYLYTTLMRHVRAGRLAKRGKGYRLPPVSPKGGTGGIVTPSGLNGQTPDDMRAAVTAAPEAGGI